MACKVENCDNTVLVAKYELCQLHYNRFRTNGFTDLKSATKNCAVCTCEFTAYAESSVIQKYCSDACARSGHMQRAREREGNSAYMKRYKWAYKLKNVYGLTVEQYEAMQKSQRGCCAICQRHEAQIGEILVVDHCHKTAQARGLLCRNCNAALGGFKDDPALLQRAVEYLAKR